MGQTLGLEPQAPGDALFADTTITARTVDRDWLAVIASSIGLIFSVGTIGLYSFGVFIRPLGAEFGWTRTQMFAAVAFQQYALGLSAPIWGLLVDRFGPRAVMLPSIVAMSLLLASLALLTPHLWHLYLIFSAVPLLAGGATPLGYSAVLTRLFDRKLGFALGIALMGVGLGATILPALAQALVGAFSWRAAYVALGVLCFVLTFPAALIATRNVPGRVSVIGRAALPISGMLRSRAFVLMCAAFIVLGIATVGTVAQIVPMMIDRGFTPPAAARVASLVGITALIGRGGLGWVLDRVHAPYVLVVIALIAGTSSLLLAFDPGASAGYLAAICTGFAVGAEVDFISFLVRRYFDQAVFGRLYGIAFGLFILGSGTGPLLLSASYDHLGGYKPGLLFFVLLTLTACGLAFALPKYAIRRPLR